MKREEDFQGNAPHLFWSGQQLHEERRRRWRLVLGETEEADQPEQGTAADDLPERGEGLPEPEQGMDEALQALYGDSRGGDLSDSMPDVARWLGDIRTYFPEPVVQLMQRDALQRLNTRQLLERPELLAQVEPDVQLAAKLLSLRRTMPAKTRDTAREVVAKVVEELMRRLEHPLKLALSGRLDRATRSPRPRRLQEINWQRTIYANLKHYQPEQGTIIPEKLVGYGRKHNALRDVILCLDTSGSMLSSVVYASVAAAVMASIPALATRLLLFDTAVVDMSEHLHDPVELLFGMRLGGGTNIARALAYCQQAISRPQETTLVLITDLFEAGDKTQTVQRAAAMAADGVKVIVLLALNDQGAPRYNEALAQELANLDIPAFACTPDHFPELMAEAIRR
jgi:Mg-chelatase subunit ChlD